MDAGQLSLMIFNMVLVWGFTAFGGKVYGFGAILGAAAYQIWLA